jgi:hypothetical protein
MLTGPAFAADGAAGMLGLRWGKNAFNFEGMPSGPQPLRNLSRLPDGKANAGRLVGDYRNPILTPEAAAVVKQKGELAIAGKGFPNAQDQCRAIAPPFTFAMTLGFAMLPAKAGDIVMVNDQNANVRHIRMNGTHPAKVVPSSMGDSVGHWEGDTLVVDVVGFNEATWLDYFGHPHTDQLHVVERYSRPNKQTLHYEALIDDVGAYTKPFKVAWDIPWRANAELSEYICQENNKYLQRLTDDFGQPVFGK